MPEMEPIKHTLEVKEAHKKRAKHKADMFKSRLTFERHWTDKVADFMTVQFGTVWFLIWHAAFFIGWIEWNLGILGLPVFDPFPFGLLTMVVSLEAIGLAIVVLISQNRQSKIADLRQQMDFEIDVRAEAEITKILRMHDALHHHLGISKVDRELRWMENVSDIREIQERIEKENDS